MESKSSLSHLATYCKFKMTSKFIIENNQSNGKYIILLTLAVYINEERIFIMIRMDMSHRSCLDIQLLGYGIFGL